MALWHLSEASLHLPSNEPPMKLPYVEDQAYIQQNPLRLPDRIWSTLIIFSLHPLATTMDGIYGGFDSHQDVNFYGSYPSNFEWSDHSYLLDDLSMESSSSPTEPSPENSTAAFLVDNVPQAEDQGPQNSNITINSGSYESRPMRADAGHRIAFRTKSEFDVLDDGFKWRKYGKKQVKNSPNPRNYYKCSTNGCQVKKRVERDREDENYVITSYDGVHNHESPCIVYCTPRRLTDDPSMEMVPHPWSLQATAQFSSA